MDYLWYCYVFILGSVAGSFLYLCILRISRKESILHGKLLHPCCLHPFGFREKIPVPGFFSPAKFLCEFLYAILAVLCVKYFGFDSYALLLMLFAAVLIVAAGIDCCTMMIPDLLSLIIIGISIVNFILSPEKLSSGIIGFFILSVPMLLFSLATNGFGGGDIKLCAACGLFLGYRLALAGFLAACILASLAGLFLMVRKGKNKTYPFPFGPFLAAGFILSALWGSPFLSWYLSLL